MQITDKESVAVEKKRGPGRGRPRGPSRDDVTVRMDRTLVRRAKAVADYEGTSIAALLSELLKEPLDRRYLRMLRQLEDPS